LKTQGKDIHVYMYRIRPNKRIVLLQKHEKWVQLKKLNIECLEWGCE